MILARITGSVVSTIHHPIVDGRKLLLADRLDLTGKPTGGYIIAMDAIGAGQGETVLIQSMRATVLARYSTTATRRCVQSSSALSTRSNSNRADQRNNR